MRIALWALLTLTIVLGLPGALRAEDDAEAEKRPVLSLRIYNVGALASGRVAFQSSFTSVQKPDDIAERRQGEDGLTYLVGQVDELIELVKGFVDPVFWESTEGADIRSLGEGALTVRASDAVHLQVARYLAGLERRYLRTVAVDVQAVRLSPSALTDLMGAGSGGRLDAAKVDGLLAGEARGPGVRLVLENRARGEVFGGAQRAFVRRHEAVRHPQAEVTVPIAGVTNPGFAVAVEPLIHADGRSVRLRMDVSWSGKTMRKALRTAKDEVVELPAPATLNVRTDVIVGTGAWHLAHADTNGWSVLVRAVPGAGVGLARTAQAVAFGAPVAASKDKMEARYFDVASLAQSMEEVYGTGAYLYDTSYDGPPAAGELEGYTPPLPAEALVELIREGIGSYAMWEDPATIEARNGLLIVRNTKPVLAAIETLLTGLRRATPAVFSTRVALVEVDAGLRRKLLRTPQRAGEAWLLDEDAKAMLLAAIEAREATRLSGGLLTSIHGRRNVLRSGQRFDYVSSYKAVRRGSEGVVIEPVVATGFAGLELDLRATLAPGGGAVHLEARCMHTHLVEPVRTIGSAHGDVELPELDTLSLRTTATAPLDRAAVVAVIPHRGREVLLLLTPRRQGRDK